MKSKLLILSAWIVLLGACSSVYYGAMEKVGVHKREIMVDRVKKARDAQNEAKQQFLTAMEQFKGVVNFQGGDLEERFGHGDAQGLGLVGPGDDAPVVAGQDDDRLSRQVGPEEPFAGDEEVVAVAEGKAHGNLLLVGVLEDPGDPPPDRGGGKAPLEAAAGQASRFGGDHVGAPDGVEQFGLAVVDMAHDHDDRRRFRLHKRFPSISSHPVAPMLG